MKPVQIWSALAVAGCLMGGNIHAEDVSVPKTPEQKQYDLNLHFDSGKANLQPEDEAAILKAGMELENYPFAVATVEGYADSNGSQAANQQLSEDRAQAVKDYLTTHYTIQGSRVKARGMGETRPVADNATREGQQRNRTVLVTVDRFMTSQQDQMNKIP